MNGHCGTVCAHRDSPVASCLELGNICCANACSFGQSVDDVGKAKLSTVILDHVNVED